MGEADRVQQLLDRVNQDWTHSRMWRAVETHLCLWGQSFRWVNRADSIDPSGWEIWPLRPDKVMVVGNDGTISGYIHDPNGSRFAMLPDEVIWDRYFNPADHYKGLSPLEAVRASVQMQLDMLEFNRRFFKHGILASNLVFFLDQMSTSQQDIDMLHERMSARYSGMENAQRPILAPGQGSVQNLGLSNRDMEFVQGIQLAKEHVADIYGVPEELMAGAQHPTFGNRDAAIRDFYAHTVTQEWDLLASEMQEQFVPMLPPTYRNIVLRFDTEEIEEMQETLSDRWKREIAQAKAGVLTINEIRSGWGRPDVPWGNEPLIARGGDGG